MVSLKPRKDEKHEKISIFEYYLRGMLRLKERGILVRK